MDRSFSTSQVRLRGCVRTWIPQGAPLPCLLMPPLPAAWPCPRRQLLLDCASWSDRGERTLHRRQDCKEAGCRPAPRPTHRNTPCRCPQVSVVCVGGGGGASTLNGNGASGGGGGGGLGWQNGIAVR